MTPQFVEPLELQNRLFAELSRMFGEEVPLYDKALVVNRVCNETITSLLAEGLRGFSLAAARLEQTSAERHGAIRIGRPDEYRWVARFFAAFAMEPHGFYDMTNLGAKSQPIIATAFRSRFSPDHRVFCSLLMTEYFDSGTRARIEALLATREVFSCEAKALIERNERQGGLSHDDGNQLIHEGVTRIFKWTGRARDHGLYRDLCGAGFKIAADIACFESHHLNHLTPNTLGMDLYTAAMKFCLGEMDEATFRARATITLDRLRNRADHDYIRLHFKHLTLAEIDAFEPVMLPEEATVERVERLTRRLKESDLVLAGLKHAGFKDFTEGPPEAIPVLLRQDSYKALTEPVQFLQADGSIVEAFHTARFGEIEQRFYATTPAGRALYDRCLAAAEVVREADSRLIKEDFAAYELQQAGAFGAFPKTLHDLLERKLVFGRFSPTAAGVAAARDKLIDTTEMPELLRRGWVAVEGLRYEDFLPVSAAGIFASNLNQYGTKSTAARKPDFTQAMLEEVLGREIVDPTATSAGIDAASRLQTYAQLGLHERLDPVEKACLEQAAAACRYHRPDRG